MLAIETQKTISVLISSFNENRYIVNNFKEELKLTDK